MREANGLTYQEIQARIKTLLVEELEADAAVIDAATDETPLLGRGIGLDSIEALRLGLAMENAFELRIPDQDLNIDLFASLGALTRYVSDKVSVRASETA